jgi:acyl carrier protein
MKEFTKQEYKNIFVEAFALGSDVDVTSLEYQAIPEWDSVGHMNLIGEIEDSFDIMMDIDDVIDFSSFTKGIELLEKYEVSLSE